MKDTLHYLFIILLLVASCSEDSQNTVSEDDLVAMDAIISGGVYHDYTDVAISKCNVTVYVNNDTLKLNKVEAIYSSCQPTSNQNNLLIFLTDTIEKERTNFYIFTPYIKPEVFFTKSTLSIDSIQIGWDGLIDNYFNIQSTFTWDTVSFVNGRFSGKASFNIEERINGQIRPNRFYPKQTIVFEF